MDSTLGILIYLLPFAFGLHNIEEVMGMEKYTASKLPFKYKPVSTLQFGIAVALFTALGFLIVYGKGLYPSEDQYYFFVSGFAGMVLLNVFFPHLIATSYLKRYSPGIITALFFNLPLTVLILFKFKNSHLMTSGQIIFTGIIGAATGIVLVQAFLKTGGLFDRKIRTRKKTNVTREQPAGGNRVHNEDKNL